MVFQSNTRAANVGKVTEDGRVIHGGLRQSIHYQPDTSVATMASQNNGSAANVGKVTEDGRVIHGGLRQSIHYQPNALVATKATPTNSKAVDNGNLMGHSLMNHGGSGKSVNSQLYVTGNACNKIETSGGFYTLELDDREELWREMALKAPAAFPNCESWAVPIPLSHDFNELARPGYVDTCVYLDERWVRLAFRTHYDAENKVVAKDLLITPTNSSIDLRDVRFRNAMADAWWKVGRWADRVLKGERVKLVHHLEAESKLELQKKQQRI